VLLHIVLSIFIHSFFQPLNFLAVAKR
jgi:hypothetical protein